MTFQFTDLIKRSMTETSELLFWSRGEQMIVAWREPWVGAHLTLCLLWTTILLHVEIEYPGCTALCGCFHIVNVKMIQKSKKVFMGDLLRCVIKHWPAVIGCNLTSFFLFLFSEQAMVDAEVRSGSSGAKAAMKHWHEGAAAGPGPLQLFPGGDKQGEEPMIILIIYFIYFDWRVFFFLQLLPRSTSASNISPLWEQH